MTALTVTQPLWAAKGTSFAVRRPAALATDWRYDIVEKDTPANVIVDQPTLIANNSPHRLVDIDSRFDVDIVYNVRIYDNVGNVQYEGDLQVVEAVFGPDNAIDWQTVNAQLRMAAGLAGLNTHIEHTSWDAVTGIPLITTVTSYVDETMTDVLAIHHIRRRLNKVGQVVGEACVLGYYNPAVVPSPLPPGSSPVTDPFQPELSVQVATGPEAGKLFFDGMTIVGPSINNPGNPETITVWLLNTGKDVLNLTGSPIVQTVSESVVAATVTQPSKSYLLPGEFAAVEIELERTGAHANAKYACVFKVPTDDSNEPEFVFTIVGQYSAITVSSQELEIERTSSPTAGSAEETPWTDDVNAVAPVAGVPFNLEYEITNSGGSDVTVSADASIENEVNCSVAITTALAAATVISASGGMDTVGLQVTPTAAGPFMAVLKIVNDTADENPVLVIIRGWAAAAATAAGFDADTFNTDFNV